MLQPQREWANPPETLALSRDDVHVWKLRLNKSESDLHVLGRTLASDERAKAGRFHFERDRRRFIAARGQLRLILGRYCEADPRSVVFSYGPRGKPFLAQPVQARKIAFNLSHSGELALAAVTQNRSIGIDLEEIHPLDDFRRIAERFFSPRENEVLSRLPESEQLEAFFHCWTRKEAYVKATGDGLARPTESFDVSFLSGEPARLLSVGGGLDDPECWLLVGLVPEHDYVGAVAVERRGLSQACWQWIQHT